MPIEKCQGLDPDSLSNLPVDLIVDAFKDLILKEVKPQPDGGHTEQEEEDALMLACKLVEDPKVVKQMHIVAKKSEEQFDLAALMTIQEVIGVVPELGDLVNAGIDVAVQTGKTVDTASHAVEAATAEAQIVSDSGLIPGLPHIPSVEDIIGGIENAPAILQNIPAILQNLPEIEELVKNGKLNELQGNQLMSHHYHQEIRKHIQKARDTYNKDLKQHKQHIDNAQQAAKNMRIHAKAAAKTMATRAVRHGVATVTQAAKSTGGTRKKRRSSRKTRKTQRKLGRKIRKNTRRKLKRTCRTCRTRRTRITRRTRRTRITRRTRRR